jgi:hypothetical protein
MTSYIATTYDWKQLRLFLLPNQHLVSDATPSLSWCSIQGTLSNGEMISEKRIET